METICSSIILISATIVLSILALFFTIILIGSVISVIKDVIEEAKLWI